MESTLCSAEECHHRELHRRLDRRLRALAAGGACLHAVTRMESNMAPACLFISCPTYSQVYDLMGSAGLSEYIWLGAALSVALTITLQERSWVKIPSIFPPTAWEDRILSKGASPTKIEELRMFSMPEFN